MPEKLQGLYWGEKLSSPEIAKIYHCNPSYIRELLRRYKIRIRTNSEVRRLVFKIDIPKKELEKLYLKKDIKICQATPTGDE